MLHKHTECLLTNVSLSTGSSVILNCCAGKKCLTVCKNSHNEGCFHMIRHDCILVVFVNGAGNHWQQQQGTIHAVPNNISIVPVGQFWYCISVSVLVWTQLGWNWEWTCIPARCLLGQSDEHVSPPGERQISKAVKTGLSDHFLLQRWKVTVCGALPRQHAGSLGGEDVWVETGKKEELKKKQSAWWLSLCVQHWSAGSENCLAIK